MSSRFDRNEVGELGSKGGEPRSGLNHGTIPEQYMNITGSQGSRAPQSSQRGARKPVPIDSSADWRNEFDSDMTVPTEHQPSYQPRHATELPTHEKPSGSRVGVGSLPGSNTETGVASLPDEREGGSSKGKASRVRGGGPTGGNPFDSDTTIPTEHQPAYQPRHATQLPTHEHPSGSRVGVGSLPGGNNETGVAFLRDERGRKLPEHLRKGHAARPQKEGRNQWDSDMTIPTEHQPAYQPCHPTELPTHELPSGSRVSIGSLPGKNTDVEVAELPDERLSERGKAARPRGGGVEEVLTAPPPHQPFYQPRHAVQLPTHERPSGSRVGVGSLPGNNNEFGVAWLPDERGAGNPYVHSQATVGSAAWSPFRSALRKYEYDLPTQEEPSGSSVGVGSLPGDISEAGVATLPEERENGKPYGTRRTGFESYSPAKGALPHAKGQNPHQNAEKMAGTMYNRSKEVEAGTGALFQSHEITLKHVEDYRVMSRWDLPSKEKISGSRCGVGSLPGKRSEQGVAMLPEERLHNADEILNSHLPPRMDQLPSREHISGSKVGVGSLPGKRSEQGVALTPEERLHPADDILNSHLPPRMDQMPSREHPSGSTVGVGSLPGKRSEQGVALTPEERLHPAKDILMSHLPPRGDQLPSMEHMSGSVVGVGSLPGQRNEKAVALTPEERQHPADQILASHHRQSRKAHRQHLAKKSGEQQEKEKQERQGTSAGRGLSGWAPPDTFPRQHEGRQQEGPELADDREARLKAEERNEMMRKTIERIEGEVMHTMHGVEQGFEQMKHKVKETFGWEHPGTSGAPAGGARGGGAGRMPGGFPGRTASSESVQERGTGTDLSGSGDQNGPAQSHLSPTAVEFVPGGRRASVSDARMMKSQQCQEHPQDTAAGGWWPTAIPAIPAIPTGTHLGEVFKDVTHKISESVEEYLHPGQHELADIFDSPSPRQKRSGGRSNVQSSERAPRSMTASLAEATSHPLPASPGDSLRGSPVPFQGQRRDSEDVTSSSDDEEQEASKVYRDSKEKAFKAKIEEEQAGVVFPTRMHGSGVVEPRASPLPGMTSDGRKVFTPARATTLPVSGGSLNTASTSIPSKVSPEYFRTGSPYGAVETGESGDVFGARVGAQPRETSDILTGAGGVNFSMKPGEGGELPGYPTQTGMSKLLSNRIAEDKIRASAGSGQEGAQTATNTTSKVQTQLEPRGPAPAAQALLVQGFSRMDSSASTTAVRGSSSDLRLDDNESTPTGGTPVGLPLPSKFSDNRTPGMNTAGVEAEKSMLDKGSKQQEFEQFFPAAGKPIN